MELRVQIDCHHVATRVLHVDLIEEHVGERLHEGYNISKVIHKSDFIMNLL